MQQLEEHITHLVSEIVIKKKKKKKMSVSFMERCNGNVESVKGCGEV